MYWRQVALSVLAAGITYIWLGSVFYGVAAFAVARIGLAVVGRTRYWVARGTKGVHTEHCPKCHGSRYRSRGDWILTCHRCGWRPGWPGVRWLTRSVPAIQSKRTLDEYDWLAAIGLIATLLGYGIPGLADVDLPSLDSRWLLLPIMIAIVVLVAWAAGQRPPTWECQQCGEQLEREHKPAGCPMCGSGWFEKLQ